MITLRLFNLSGKIRPASAGFAGGASDQGQRKAGGADRSVRGPDHSSSRGHTGSQGGALRGNRTMEEVKVFLSQESTSVNLKSLNIRAKLMEISKDVAALRRKRSNCNENINK